MNRFCVSSLSWWCAFRPHPSHTRALSSCFPFPRLCPVPSKHGAGSAGRRVKGGRNRKDPLPAPLLKTVSRVSESRKLGTREICWQERVARNTKLQSEESQLSIVCHVHMLCAHVHTKKRSSRWQRRRLFHPPNKYITVPIEALFLRFAVGSIYTRLYEVVI